jgi:hypothetical protein
MTIDTEHFNILRRLWEKSLILESTAEFEPVLYFYFLDALAHIDFSLSLMAFNYQSPRNIMNMEYLRWRLDQEKVGDRPKFPGFINWLKENHPDEFETLPVLWQEIYDTESPASYRSFRISLDPDSLSPVPTGFFIQAIEEFFSKPFLKSIYRENSLGRLFAAYAQTH